MRFWRIAFMLAVAALAVCRLGSVAVAAGPEAAHGASTGAAGHGEEKPDLVGTPKTRMITAITTLIIFLLLVAVLGKTAWGPIAKGLQDREDKIRKDIADAEAARERAEATLKEYGAKLAAAEAQIRQMLAKAQADAEGVAAGIKVKAQSEAEEIKERALKDIDATKKAAMAEIHEHAATLATSVAEKILRRNINDGDQRELVKSSLEQLQSLARN